MPARVFSLGDLNGQNGFALPGVRRNDQCGASVSAAGDINDDGINRLITGGVSCPDLVADEILKKITVM